MTALEFRILVVAVVLIAAGAFAIWFGLRKRPVRTRGGRTPVDPGTYNRQAARRERDVRGQVRRDLNPDWDGPTAAWKPEDET